MLTTTLLYFGISSACLALLTVLYVVEARSGGRVVLGGLRSHFDHGLTALLQLLNTVTRRVSRFLARTVLQFGVYRLLGSLLARLIQLERRAERLIRQHRPSSGEKRERNHLDEIADHKDAVALTERQKKRLRDT